MIFIDAESNNHCSKIIGQGKSVGVLYEARYYALQNDSGTEAWRSVAKQYSIKPILLYMEDRNQIKVDCKIIKDIKYILEKNKSIDIFCIVSRDSDFSEIVQYIRAKNKSCNSSNKKYFFEIEKM